MKVSLNTVKSLIDFELPPTDELVSRISARLGKVDKIIDLGQKYKDATIVQIVECQKHPNADKLSICQIDTGASENVQVVCGAPNVRAGMWAVWLPPDSVVPTTYDTDDPFILGARELRGVMSHGMLAAGDELAINNDHDGIIEITAEDVRGDKALVLGAKFADVFGLQDQVIDIENKMFTHRPDLFGHIGVAREIAGIFGQKFTEPTWYGVGASTETSNELPLEVFNEIDEKVPRFMVASMSGITVKPSPLWLQCALVAMGSKAINNIVDATNYIMLLTAQPTHAYDYDKLRGGKIGARMANDGETAVLLNGKEHTFTPDDIVIADGAGVIGLAGIMGGLGSEVSAETKNIVLEVANFNMYAVRKSSMRHGLFTDALTRFNKGQSPYQNPVVMKELATLMSLLTGARIASSVYDLGNGFKREHAASLHIENGHVTDGFINTRLGTALSNQDVAKLLNNVNFNTELTDTGVSYAVPFWRTDIEQAEDIVEEVGRLYGFDNLPRELPMRSGKPAAVNLHRQLQTQLRHGLRRLGANEVLTYSFVHERTIAKADQDQLLAYKLSNALSPDLQYYRLSLLPSLLEKVHPNIKAGYETFSLFEIGKGHHKSKVDSDGLPNEQSLIEMVVASRKPQQGAAFYAMRRQVESLLDSVGAVYTIEALADHPIFDSVEQPYDRSRSACIKARDGSYIGIIGELKASVRQAFKLTAWSAAASLDIDMVQQSLSKETSYRPLSRYPSLTQDISLKVPATCSYSELRLAVESAITSFMGEYSIELQPVTIYQPSGADSKTVTFRVKTTSDDKTLTDKVVAPIMQRIATVAAEACDASVV